MDLRAEAGETPGKVGYDRLPVGQFGAIGPGVNRGDDPGGGLEWFFGHWRRLDWGDGS